MFSHETSRLFVGTDMPVRVCSEQVRPSADTKKLGNVLQAELKERLDMLLNCIIILHSRAKLPGYRSNKAKGKGFIPADQYRLPMHLMPDVCMIC